MITTTMMNLKRGLTYTISCLEMETPGRHVDLVIIARIQRQHGKLANVR